MNSIQERSDPGLPDFWQHLCQRPDELMLELGAGGELLVAKLRAALSLALLLLPLANIVAGQYSPYESVAGMLGVIAAIALSQIWLTLARQQRRYRWLPWVTTAYDVSLTTLVLVLLALDSPMAALNSMVAWAFYLISISMTALRNDGRVTLFAGGLSILQFTLLSAIIFLSTSGPEQLAPAAHETASVITVVQRLLLVVIVTAITAAVVYRMQRLVELSGTDGLTGLPNRTLLVHRFPHLIDMARDHSGSLSICLIDLDHFRRINDDAGHMAGDRALRHVVTVLHESLQEEDWLARLGGEEFVLLMHVPTGRAWERLDAMRRQLAISCFSPEPGDDPMQLTFSAGVASWPQDGADLSQLLRRADLRLRAAKLEGGNRVVARES